MIDIKTAAVDELRESEIAVLACVMVDPSVADLVAAEVAASDFADRQLGQVFALLVDGIDAGQPIGDHRVLVSMLRAAGLLDSLGGALGVGRMIHDSPNGSAAIWHARRVRRAAGCRKLDALGKQLQADASDPNGDPYEIIKRIDAMAGQFGGDDMAALVTIEDATRAAIAEIRRCSETGRSASLPRGLYSLDAALGGFYPGELIILAARPSIGKSALAGQIASYSASRGRGVLLVSLEMPGKDLGFRGLAAELGAEVRVLRAGKLSPSKLAEADAHADSLAGQPLRIHYGRSVTVQRIRGLARLMAASSEGLSIVAVDYLGLVTPTDRRRQRWEQVSEISAALKSLALELGVPVLACCQLGRDAEGKPPTLAQLRDSGSIEQDADVVMLLHRADRDSRVASLNIAKNRNGGTGEIELGFDPATTCFFDGGGSL